jgi:hypothetical protein
LIARALKNRGDLRSLGVATALVYLAVFFLTAFGHQCDYAAPVRPAAHVALHDGPALQPAAAHTAPVGHQCAACVWQQASISLLPSPGVPASLRQPRPLPPLPAASRLRAAELAARPSRGPPSA